MLKRKPLKTARYCFKCGEEIKDNSAVSWFIVKNRLYCRKCALKKISK